MEEESRRRNHGGGNMEEESWKMNWKMNHGGGTMEEESWRRNHGGGIMKEDHGGTLGWDMLVETILAEITWLGYPGRDHLAEITWHPRGTWEAPRRHPGGT